MDLACHALGFLVAPDHLTLTCLTMSNQLSQEFELTITGFAEIGVVVGFFDSAGDFPSIFP